MRIENDLKTDVIPSISTLLDIEVDGKIEIWSGDVMLRSGDSKLDKPLKEQLYLDVAPLDTMFLSQLRIESDSDKVVYHFEDESPEDRRNRYLKLKGKWIERKVGDKTEYINIINGYIGHSSW